VKKSELRQMIREEVQLLREGYSLYWGSKPNKPYSAKDWAKIVKATKEIIQKAASKKIIVKGPSGDGEPVINNKEIALNGDDAKGKSAESFVLSKNGKSDSCKTDKKPYTAVVASILYVADNLNNATNARHDGGKKHIKLGGPGRNWTIDYTPKKDIERI